MKGGPAIAELELRISADAAATIFMAVLDQIVTETCARTHRHVRLHRSPKRSRRLQELMRFTYEFSTESGSAAETQLLLDQALGSPVGRTSIVFGGALEGAR